MQPFLQPCYRVLAEAHGFCFNAALQIILCKVSQAGEGFRLERPRVLCQGQGDETGSRHSQQRRLTGVD